MTEVPCRLEDLPNMHPRLLWETISLAAAAALGEGSDDPDRPFTMHVGNVPGFGSDELVFRIDRGRFSGDSVLRFRRTFEPSRQVEMAAIAIAGLAFGRVGPYEICDVALRGSAADYLVGESRYRLEIAGRSRRTDLETAWQQKWNRLSQLPDRPSFVFVAEFETRTARLGFAWNPLSL